MQKTSCRRRVVNAVSSNVHVCVVFVLSFVHVCEFLVVGIDMEVSGDVGNGLNCECLAGFFSE